MNSALYVWDKLKDFLSLFGKIFIQKWFILKLITKWT